jgi:capping protein beta
VEIDESSRVATYTLTTSVLMWISLDVGLVKPLSITGAISERRRVTKPWETDDDHIVNVGELIESNGANFHDSIDWQVLSKIKSVVEIITGNFSHERPLAEVEEEINGLASNFNRKSCHFLMTIANF